MGFLKKLLQPKHKDNSEDNSKASSKASSKAIIVVSGLPRSGTSMMMRMLEQGGVPVLVDHIRTPNEDNPLGYYEFERVKKMPEGDFAWLEEAKGSAVKVLAVLLMHLPENYTYNVLFMRRNMQEMLDSQRAMLVRRGEDADRIDDSEMARLFDKHLDDLYAWMDSRSNVRYLEVDYNAVLENPSAWAQKVQQFLGMQLDGPAMISVVAPELYRQRQM